jgi:hypothetical protein
MTLKETVLYEIETADERLLEEVMRVIRSHHLSGRELPKHTTPIVGEASRNGDRSPNHPLRGIPIAIPADFNEPMTDLWEAVEQ